MTAQPAHAAGTMLALYLNEHTASALAVDGGLDPADMHVTVAYTGKAHQVDPWRLHDAAAAVVDRAPIAGMISGHARFAGGEDGDVIVALVDSPDLERLRRDVVDALAAQGIDLPADHGFTAHATIAYIGPDAPSPVERIDPIPVTFSALSVVHGVNRSDLPFTQDPPRSLASLAREAYAQGWAASGGPMTDRVKAGCTAAVDMALAHCDEPGVLEATLHLGHLEGVWASIYERREQLHADNLAQVLAVWRPMVATLDLDTFVRQVRHHDRVGESLTEASLRSVADYALNLLRHLLHSAKWRDLRQVVRDAIARGQAEGVAGALAMAADQRGVIGLSFDIAFEDAYRALANARGLYDEADAWLTRMLGDSASDLGRTLAGLARDEASYEDMLSAAEDLLGSDNPRAVSYIVDLLSSRALSQGALDLYASEGVQRVDFLSAGDSRVCPACLKAESGSPYSVASAPRPGLHGGCRCTVAATDPLSLSTIQQYLPTGGT